MLVRVCAPDIARTPEKISRRRFTPTTGKHCLVTYLRERLASQSIARVCIFGKRTLENAII